jgi:EAL domain-containing protein (putative c-di-GMP-specific phosphodiesterase class I)
MRGKTNGPARENRPHRNRVPVFVQILLISPLLGFSQARDPSAHHRTLRTVHDVFALSKSEASKAYPIELDAVVTFSDPEWGVLFVQDRTSPTFVDVHGTSTKFAEGTHVRVEAVTGTNNNGPILAHAKIIVLGRGLLPKLEQKSIAGLDAELAESHRAVTEGTLRPCERSYPRVCFLIYEGKKFAWLFVPQLDSPAAQGLIGATVRVTGVVGRHVDDASRRLGAQLWVNRLDDKEDAALVAENLLDAISSPFKVEGHELKIGASVGISVFPENASVAEELMKQADSAMYAAKRAGRNRVMTFTPEIGSLMHERLSLEILLRGAIARHEISVQYQPEFELAGMRLVRFEALARWTHPTLGSIPPGKFIPIAEESGMIDILGAYIMEQACAEAVRWQGIVSYPIQVAVNVSSIQFRGKGFVEEVCEILDRSGLKPELLQIELTESVRLSGAHIAAETMNRLHELGISLAIDDFGTGYSNLSYLPSLPFDVVKIDRSFVLNMETRPERESMIRTVIALARDIGMRAIVEGIETPQQLELIKTLGANEVQGYLTGKPTANPIADFLKPLPDARVEEQEIGRPS